MNQYVTIKEAALLEKISYRTMARRVVQNKVDVIIESSKKQKGKTVTLIAVTSLSIPAQKRYLDMLAGEKSPQPPSSKGEQTTSPISGETKLIAYNELLKPNRAKVDKRFETLMIIQDAMEQPGAVLENICEENEISFGTFYRWKKKFEAHGISGLADNRFGWSRSKLNEDQRNYIVGLINQNPDRRAIRIFEYLAKKFPQPAVSGETVRRFVDKWKNENHELFAFLKNPDMWKNNYQLAYGSQSEKAEHFLHYVELDSTPADLICADGKRYNIIGAIDIFSRKPKCHVSPSSSGQGVAALFRSLILDWGVPETIVRDNGKDYVSNHVNSILHSLDIVADTVAPFTPEGKPHIERFFRTLSGGLFEELEGYIGHNVAQRKAIESRRSFARKMMNSEASPIQLSIMPDELQTLIDGWIENVYNQRVHKGINDTPEHKAAQSVVPIRKVDDERALDILLVPVGEATVQKKGIRYDNANYQSPELSGWVKERVQIRRDIDNAGILYVFDSDGQYITTAWDPSIEGMPSIDYQSARKQQRRDIQDQKKAIATLTQNPMQEMIAEKSSKKKLVSMPRQRTAKTAALEEAKNAALARRGIKPERFKSVAEQMHKMNNAPGSAYPVLDDDPFDFMSGIKIVND